MNILIIGGGGREHALGWKLEQSPRVKKIFFAPGNGGTVQLGENINIKAHEIDKLLSFVIGNKIDLTVVGPENPLAIGIVDLFNKKGLTIFGPTQKAARLESDKTWAAEFMKRHSIPQPDFQIFNNSQKATHFIKTSPWKKIVVKAYGLALGKGVIVTNTKEEAIKAVNRILIEKEFGEAGNKIILQECLYGEEVSVLAMTDGKTLIPLLPAQDHKRIFDKDKGPNTGGVGAYSPVPFVTKKLMSTIIKTVFLPTINGMKKEGSEYKGVLYAGLMVTEEGPKVLEFNVRFGDPEMQPQLMLLKSDLLKIILSCTNGTLHKQKILFKKGNVVCVVLAAGGYPSHYGKGEIIHGLKTYGRDIQIFHAGTTVKDNKIVTNGGRVLGITAYAKTMKQAIKKVYSIIGRKGVYFNNMHYRKDIGKKAYRIDAIR